MPYSVLKLLQAAYHRKRAKGGHFGRHFGPFLSIEKLKVKSKRSEMLLALQWFELASIQCAKSTQNWTYFSSCVALG